MLSSFPLFSCLFLSQKRHFYFSLSLNFSLFHSHTQFPSLCVHLPHFIHFSFSLDLDHMNISVSLYFLCIVSSFPLYSYLRLSKSIFICKKTLQFLCLPCNLFSFPIFSSLLTLYICSLLLLLYLLSCFSFLSLSPDYTFFSFLTLSLLSLSLSSFLSTSNFPPSIPIMSFHFLPLTLSISLFLSPFLSSFLSIFSIHLQN